METRDSQSVQSATLSLPPRTIGVAGAAPPDALAFITLIQQNSALTPKSPGAEATTSSGYVQEDRPSDEDRQSTAEEDYDSATAASPSDDAQTTYESDDAHNDIPEVSIPAASEAAPVDDEPDEEDVVVGEVKVATAVEEAPPEQSGEEAVDDPEAVKPADSNPLDQLGDDAGEDQATATELQTEQDEAIGQFDAQQSNAVAEENSAAADSETLHVAKASGDKEKKSDTDAELSVAQEGAEPVVDANLQQQTAGENLTDGDEDNNEQIEAAQEAAAAALEQEPVDDGPTDAEQFAADRREASEKISKTNEARQEAPSDGTVDPTADVEAIVPTQAAAESTPIPGTHAAIAAVETGVPPTNGGGSQSATAASGETSSVNEPGLGTAIQRGLQRGLLQKAKAGSDAPKIDSAKQIQLIQRVSQAVRTAQAQGGPIRLRLSPPELGSLRVELEVEEGGVKAKLEAENETVKKVLLDSLPQLRDRLAELNLRVDSFEVSVGQNGNPQDAGGTLADQQQNSSNQQTTNGQQRSTNGETSSVETTSTPIVASDGTLNVMV
ncbi:flagellar hook-length control protein FliK [Blastopirellula sp. JC732]|uniref:Flagellar hook-length control protein FliK n=1 Tax=Blastopirellula sediminis TaxID=2894196 RepID=A0A9X1MS39_9BACT|nr:flagellar hook-length control protein FliK [Blastopirellula sediminis]MCC9605673.1 flagellar hook-length control protein FliK [Blastopirellula sediminis]MCC9631027.1 flagellar hook-length control protein FliK [Blastopirellula sediminis]